MAKLTRFAYVLTLSQLLLRTRNNEGFVMVAVIHRDEDIQPAATHKAFLPISIWCWFKDVAVTLKPCRFSALMVLLGATALILVPQCQEALRGLAERDEVRWLVTLQWSTFFTAAMVWAFSAWYWARQMLNLCFPSTPPSTPRRESFRKLIPRILGVGALLSVAVALWNSGRVYRGGALNHDAAVEIAIAEAVAMGLTGLFFLFVWLRRKLFKIENLVDSKQARRFKELASITWWLLLGSALLAFTFFLMFWLAPLKFAPLIGAPAILLFAASTWIPLGSFVVYLGSRYEFPILSLVFVAAAVFSFWNDNHALRTLPGELSTPIPIDASANEWLRLRADEIKTAKAAGRRYPVFVVAAAGGGIRAAYWTASLLSAFEDQYRGKFASHTFAISGVSGGSLGAATFVALTAQNAIAPLHACRDKPANHIQPCADAVLSQDFLSPALASMLYPDLTQRFLPFGIQAFDRARVLEGSWEAAWDDQGMPADPFKQSLHDLWKTDHARKLPLLFLNSTVVESGQRAIVSPVAIEGFKGFDDALDVAALTNKPIPLSAAAHLSARFTYLSPAAATFDAQNKLRAHLVDGGYFENSGGTTAANVLAVLGDVAERMELRDSISLWVILIGNAPGYIADGESHLDEPQHFIMEARAPIEAIFNARDARGRYAEANVAQYARPYGGDALVFGLQPSDVPLPLGWMLSDSAQHEIDRQTDALLREPSKNKSMSKIDALLTDLR